MFKIDISIHNIKDITDCLGISVLVTHCLFLSTMLKKNLKINVSGFIVID